MSFMFLVLLHCTHLKYFISFSTCYIFKAVFILVTYSLYYHILLHHFCLMSCYVYYVVLISLHLLSSFCLVAAFVLSLHVASCHVVLCLVSLLCYVLSHSFCFVTSFISCSSCYVLFIV